MKLTNSKILEMLYTGDITMEVEVNHPTDGGKRGFVCDVEFFSHSFGGKIPDLRVSNFYRNFRYRTSKGVNRQKYKSLYSALRAIKNVCRVHGYEATNISITLSTIVCDQFGYDDITERVMVLYPKK